LFYFLSFKNDGRFLKFLVATLSVVDTVHIILVSDLLGNMLIRGRSKPTPSYPIMPWSARQLMASFTLVFFVTFVVQCFFCARVWQVSGKNTVIATIIGVTAVIQLCTGLVFIVQGVKNKSTPTYYSIRINQSAQRVLLPYWISCIVCDCTISASLVYYFHKYRVGMPRTDSILHQLVVFSVNVGVLLCVISIVTLTLLELEGGSFLALAPLLIFSKLYVNCLIAMLNSRKHFRHVVDRSISFPLPEVSAGSAARLSHSVS